MVLQFKTDPLLISLRRMPGLDVSPVSSGVDKTPVFQWPLLSARLSRSPRMGVRGRLRSQPGSALSLGLSALVTGCCGLGLAFGLLFSLAKGSKVLL